MIRLAGLDQIIDYNVESADYAQKATEFLYGNLHKEVKSNLRIQQNVFQLGWDSIIKVNLENGMFRVSNIYNFNKNVFEANGTYSQIVTRAVHTCTFFYLKNGTRYILGHINSYALSACLDQLKKLLKNSEFDFGFCSHIDDKGEKDFSKDLDKLCNSYRHFIRDYSAKNLTSHIEIGVYIKTGSVELYGDVLYCNLRKNEIKCGVEFFETFEGLDGLKKNNGCLLI